MQRLYAYNMGIMPKLGPYSQSSTLAKVDKRTKEARLVASLRRELIEHVGGHPTVVQRVLIDQACALKLRLAMMDRGDTPGSFEMNERAQVQYLAWAGSLERTLARLGLEPAPAPRETLQDRLTAKAKATPAPRPATLPGPPTPPVFLPAGDIPDYVPPARPSI